MATMIDEQIELTEAELENAAGGKVPLKKPDLKEIKGHRGDIVCE